EAPVGRRVALRAWTPSDHPQTGQDGAGEEMGPQIAQMSPIPKDEDSGFQIPDSRMSEWDRALGRNHSRPPSGSVDPSSHLRPSAKSADPSPVPSADRPAPRPSISLVMIVRDEETNLPRALESVRGIFDEIVVVDT